MKKLTALLIALAVFSVIAAAQDQSLSMDDEPHYSRIFSNEYCRAYIVNLGRLGETKPVVHERDWVRITLGGTVEQAWGGTVFGSAPYEDPEGYYVSFLFPVARVALRNPRSEPYRAMIVEILRDDDSRNRWRDPSLDPFAQRLGPGVDSHASYVTTLTKTSVEIMNVQLLGGDTRDLQGAGAGALLVATTELNLKLSQKDTGSVELQLSKGDVRWISGGLRKFANLGQQPARFVLLSMK